jgi:hypothetical protein
MAFVPYIMTPNGPRVIYPIETIIEKKEITTEVSSSDELETELMKYIDERFNKILERIKIMEIPKGSFDINSFKINLKKQIKDEISLYLCSDCIKPGEYELNRQQIETQINDRFLALARELKATVEQTEQQTIIKEQQRQVRKGVTFSEDITLSEPEPEENPRETAIKMTATEYLRQQELKRANKK